MPSRDSTFQGSDSDIVATGLINHNTGILVKDCNEELDPEEWDDWMRWEGTTTELRPASIERRHSTASTISSLEEPWITSLETSAIDPILASYSNANDFPFEDAQLELDETPLTSASSTSNNETPWCPPAAAYTQQELRRSYHGFSSLTAAEERSLQDIAMPYHALSNINIAFAPVSPMESHASESASPSPEPEVPTRKNNKRKSIDLGELPSTLSQSKKKGHNAIEKRYRTNLNAKIECLREGIPSLTGPDNLAGEEESGGEGADSKSAAHPKYGKAAILTRALEYIQHLESTTQRLGSEVDSLKIRIGAFEKLAMGGSMIMVGGGLDGPVLTKSETLESIQSDFQAIKPKAKVVTGSTTRKRGSRQSKAS
ncbi:uncharacterized protein L3040_001473 [Drepanopeziza brunnea f. sp. 'multigermtubi']|uniref:uncharacterized protein n=1 Tax=Drepanopeziza brunnea f. sp. 'multigermtubi' TaxID=698441 RepID=UPI002396C439|nr:hypothetical protein L3040_001473 [Drepanopeziza brunnea f. sp. 'multigermtubi']